MENTSDLGLQLQSESQQLFIDDNMNQLHPTTTMHIDYSSDPIHQDDEESDSKLMSNETTSDLLSSGSDDEDISNVLINGTDVKPVYQNQLQLEEMDGDHGIIPDNSQVTVENVTGSAALDCPATTSALTKDVIDYSNSESPLIRLEKEIESLALLIKKKEKEWNQLLQLKKLKEIALEQLRRDKHLGDLIKLDRSKEVHLTKFLQSLVEDSDSTELVEKKDDVDSTLQDPEITQPDMKSMKLPSLSSSDERNLKLDNLKASTALRLLCEKGRSQNQPQNNNLPGHKIAGEVHMSEVRSIMDRFARPKPKNDDVPNCPKLNYTQHMMLNGSNTHFSDLLVSLSKIAQGAQDHTDASSVRPKNTRHLYNSTSSANSTATNDKQKAPVTLTKLLSTVNVTPAVSEANQKSYRQEPLTLTDLLCTKPSKKMGENGPILVCQGCNKSIAQFVCAGCGEQWYCSRDCQISNWSVHSEACTS